MFEDFLFNLGVNPVNDGGYWEEIMQIMEK